MADLDWSPTLEIGHPRVDGEHRALVAALGRLDQALAQGQGMEETVRVLAFLRDYTVSHFEAEEALMIQHRFPGTAEHFRAHADLVMRVSGLLADLRAGKGALDATVLGFLRGWVLEHILGMDKELGAFLHARGGAGQAP